MVSERALVERILRLTRMPNDDSALVRTSSKLLAASSDIAFSSTHSPKGISHYYMGWRSAASNLSDLAATGAQPLAFLLSLGLPSNNSKKLSQQIVKGALDACKQHGTAYAGGDVKRAKELVLAGFALGELKGKGMKRSNARAGDVVCIAGSIGDAACGFHALSKNKKTPVRLLNAFLKPRALLKQGAMVAKATKRAACMDVSDGLLFTCSEIARLSKVRIDLESLSIPISPEAHTYAASNSLPFNRLVNWGEDYSLVFSMGVRDFEKLYKKAGLVCIGFASKGRGLYLDGKKLNAKGYDAFKNSI